MKEGRAPYNCDQEMVRNMWETIAVQLSKHHCEIHKKYFCKSCTPVFLSEEEFPNPENHLKSIYSWNLFKDLLEQFSAKELTNMKPKNQKKDKNYRRSPCKDSKKLKEDNILLKNMNDLSQKVSEAFHCTFHKLFPCFVCMPKFVKDGYWPNDLEYDELWQGWNAEHSHETECDDHGKLFCDRCHGIEFLFDKFNKPGVTDVFLDLIKKVGAGAFSSIGFIYSLFKSFI